MNLLDRMKPYMDEARIGSVKTLADLTGIPRTTMQEIANRESKLTKRETALKIQQVIGCPISEIYAPRDRVRQQKKIVAKSSVGKWIQNRMKQVGIENEHHLAELTDLSFETIKALMEKDRRIYKKTVDALARALECSVDDINVEVIKRHPNTGALCWTCANAVPEKKGKGCTWSRALEPVEGATMLYGRRVVRCPEYKEG